MRWIQYPSMTALFALLVLQPDSVAGTYRLHSGTEETGAEQIEISHEDGKYTVRSILRTGDGRQYESEWVADDKTLETSYYRALVKGTPEAPAPVEYRAGGDRLIVTRGSERHESPRSPGTILVDPLPGAHFLFLLHHALAEGRRRLRVISSSAMTEVSLDIEDRGETNLVGSGKIIPVRKFFLRMEPIGLLAFVDEKNRPLVLIYPFESRRLVRDGFQSFQAPRRSELVPPEGVVETEITWESGSLEIAGSMVLPRAGAGLPAVLLLGGAGAVDRDGNTLDLRLDLYRSIAYTLGEAGIASVRYDKRGVGKSEGTLSVATLNDLTEDAREMLRQLRGQDRIDAERIALLGHDEGATIAAIVAAGDPRLKGLLLLAPAADPLDAILLRQFELAARAQKMPESDVAEGLRRRREWFEKVRAARGDWIDAEDGGKVFVGWLREHFQHDPKEQLAKVALPIALFHGEHDRLIPADHTDRLAEALRKKGNRKFDAIKFPRLDHMFMESAEGDIARYADDREPEDGFLRQLADIAVRMTSGK